MATAAPPSVKAVSELDKTIPRDAVKLATLQRGEHDQIAHRRTILEAEGLESGPIGVAVSGGGIRSATFTLGILQRLAKYGLLKHVDYLSTVSGGGYIGSWLCSWIRRVQSEERPKTVTDWTDKAKRADAKKKFEQVVDELSLDAHPSVDDPEPEQITFLRQYSNYLTPRVSVFSADTWVVGAIWSRNTLLNLGILLALFGSVILLARIIGFYALGLFPETDEEFGRALVICVGLLTPMVGLIGWNLWCNSTVALRSEPPRNRDDEQSDGTVIRFCFFPLLSAIGYSYWLDHAKAVFVDGTLWGGVRANFALLTVAYLILQICARVYECHTQKKKEMVGEVPKLSHLFSIALYVIGPLSAGFVTAALLRAVAFVFDVFRGKHVEPWFVLTFGPPLVLVAFAVGVIVHVGVLGRDLPEASREWLGRLRAWLMIFSFFWLIVFGASIYGPWLLAWVGVKSSTAIAGLGSGWVLTTIGGLLAGKSSKTSGKEDDTQNRSGAFSWMDLLARIGPYLFMAGFAISVAFGVHAILSHNQPPVTMTPAVNITEKYDLKVRDNQIQLSRDVPKVEDSGFQWVMTRYWMHLSTMEMFVHDSSRWALSGWVPLLGLLLAGGTLLVLRVDINDFSMHNFYKDRLVRCYLGASNQENRHPNPFTGFDDFDDSPLDLFTHQRGYVGPYPILNAALNVTSGGKLQYQERQAESFIFTPLYSGFSAETVVDEMRLGDEAEEKFVTAKGGYRPTRFVGDRIGVGRAMAISGAAVNPNMGYHSSTAVSFLLTVFNVRLGWWLGNTLNDNAFRRPGPKIGLIYTLSELFGLANAKAKYVNLSDGGHFENMGIYELVRRKCRFIICCDGEQDTGPTFGGIGNAIRKCRTDFGVEIDLPVERLRKLDKFARVHCAVGTISYPDSTADGYIVYLKSSLTGDEPTDILAYHSDNAEFPQQTTGDQWFDESQFESYRRLGYHVADKAFASADFGELQAGAYESFFEAMYQIWYPPSVAVDRSAGAHSDIYSRIMDAVRREPTFEQLDPALFAGLDDSRWKHQSGHMCDAMIRLMERVFYDLGLEDPAEREHPYVNGWMEIFGHWANRQEFKDAWASVKKSYPKRFQKFYESLVK